MLIPFPKGATCSKVALVCHNPETCIFPKPLSVPSKRGRSVQRAVRLLVIDALRREERVFFLRSWQQATACLEQRISLPAQHGPPMREAVSTCRLLAQ